MRNDTIPSFRNSFFALPLTLEKVLLGNTIHCTSALSMQPPIRLNQHCTSILGAFLACSVWIGTSRPVY